LETAKASAFTPTRPFRQVAVASSYKSAGLRFELEDVVVTKDEG